MLFAEKESAQFPFVEKNENTRINRSVFLVAVLRCCQLTNIEEQNLMLSKYLIVVKMVDRCRDIKQNQQSQARVNSVFFSLIESKDWRFSAVHQ